jgi:hypothetical protein
MATLTRGLRRADDKGAAAPAPAPAQEAIVAALFEED